MCYTIYFLLLIEKIRPSTTQHPAPASCSMQSCCDWDSSEASPEADRFDRPDRTDVHVIIFKYSWVRFSLGEVGAMISLIFPLFSLFSHSAPFLCFHYTLLHHQPTIHWFSSISLIAVTHRASQLRCVDRRDLIAYMKCIRCMMRTDTIETHSRQHASHNSTPPGFHM